MLIKNVVFAAINQGQQKQKKEHCFFHDFTISLWKNMLPICTPASAKGISNIQRPMSNIQVVRVLGVSTYIRH
jgi:hypothetical protein